MALLYRILKPVVKVAFRVYFRQIYLDLSNPIPMQGPVLLSANHPSAFMEACLLACFLDRPIHFLVRGDVFKKKWAQVLLRATHQIPIYRFRDGFSGMRKNQETFERVYELLGKDEVVLIFSESFTILEKRLRPIQKGTARMAFGAYERIEKEIPIVPIGINYTDCTTFRSEVSIISGPQLSTEKAYSLYLKDKQDGLNQLTRDLQRALMPLVVHIEHEQNDHWVNHYFSTYRPDSFFHWTKSVQRGDQLFVSDKKFANQVNQFQVDQLEEIKSKFSAIPHQPSWGLHFISQLGYLINFLPMGTATYIKNQIKAKPFQSPVWLGSGMLLYLLYATLLIVFGFFWQPAWWLLGGSIILGLIGIKARDQLRIQQLKAYRAQRDSLDSAFQALEAPLTD